MAANEIVLKDIMTDNDDLKEEYDTLTKEKETLEKEAHELYYNKAHTQYCYPPKIHREHLEAEYRLEALNVQILLLEKESFNVSEKVQASRQWLDKAKNSHFECEVNLFSKPHTERNTNKENNVISSCAPYTTLKFVYTDNKEPVDNGYIFYWVYDEVNTNKIEDDSYTDFTKSANPMLPVGVGRTDRNGFLRKSMVVTKKNMLKHTTNGSEHYLTLNLPEYIYNANVLNNSNPKTFKANMKDYIESWNSFGELNGSRPYSLAHAKANKVNFDYYLSKDDKDMMKNLYAYQVTKDEFSNAEEVVTKSSKGVLKNDFSRKISNKYFFLIKPYAFFCYPIDRGSFSTKDLHSLTTNNFQPAWKGMLKPDNKIKNTLKDDKGNSPSKKNKKTNNTDRVTTIEIHSTLPEWDRRIQRKIFYLKTAQTTYLTNMKSHKKAIDHLDGMAQSVSIQEKFSVDQSVSTLRKREKLTTDITNMQKAIESALHEDISDDNSVSIKKDLDDIEKKAIELRELLNSKALLEEFKRYAIDSGPKENDEHIIKPGPYMQEEPFWTHFYQTYCEAIILLRSTPLSTDIFQEEISPFLDAFIDDNFTDELMPGSMALQIMDETKDLFLEEDTIFDEDLMNRVKTLKSKKNGYEYDKQDSLIYTMLSGWRQTAGTLFHRVPGPPSVLQVVLDTYADHISKKMQNSGLKDGKNSRHIKLLMVICNYLGVFGTKDFNKNRDTLYLAFRAHGNLHKRGSKNYKGSKNYYSHKALDSRMKYLMGDFEKDLNTLQKKALKTVMQSVGKIKETFSNSFLQRPFPGFGVNPVSRGSFSDTVYTANNHFFYKGFMAVVNLCFISENWKNLPKETKNLWEEGMYLHYVAKVTDSLGQTAVTAYSTSNLVTKFRLASLVNQMEQAKKSSLLFWQKSADNLNKLSGMMDNLAASLSLLSTVIATADGLIYYDRGQTDKSMVSFLRATSSAMVTYGFFTGKYAGKAAFSYLTKKVAIRGAGLLTLSGLALFIPVIGQFAALFGAILSVGMLVYDLYQLVLDYNKSDIQQRFEFHYDAFAKINKPYRKLQGGIMQATYEGINDYDELPWNDLNLNCVIPLLEIGVEREQIQNMLEYNEYYQKLFMKKIINFYHELIKLEENNQVENYYIIDENVEFLLDVKVKLLKGEFIPNEVLLKSPYRQLNFIEQYEIKHLINDDSVGTTIIPS